MTTSDSLKRTSTLALCALALSFTAALPARAQQAAASAAPLVPVATLDLDRYMGRWHELARFPNRFQSDCAGPATADYRLQPGGTVQVINRCPQVGGKVDEAIGEARRIGTAGSPKLEVRFAPAWLSWLPFVWGSYWVIDLDPAYQLAVVSEPSREYLWVLARQPQVDAATWEALMARLRAKGFDLSRLQRAAPAPAQSPFQALMSRCRASSGKGMRSACERT